MGKIKKFTCVFVLLPKKRLKYNYKLYNMINHIIIMQNNIKRYKSHRKIQWDICVPYRHTDNNTTFNDMSFSTKTFAMLYK